MQHEVSEYQLKSGGRGLIVNVPGAPVMASQFQFRAGNRYVLDYQHKSQPAHIMEHMAFGASDGFATAHEYDATFTKNGAIYNAYTDDVSMVYEATCADFEWSRVLGLQKYAICQPHFNQDDFASEVGAVRSELIGYLSQADRGLWPRVAQAMGDDTKTFQEGLDSIPNITAEDIREHWRRTHTAGNLRFVVAGNFVGRIGQLREILNSFELGAGDRLPIAVDEMHSAPAFAIRRKDVPGIGLAISLVVPRKLSDAENEAMSLLNHILNGTLHSRIQGEARRRGLLYYMWSQLSTFEHNSSWDFGAQVSVSNLPAVVDLVTNEMQRVKDGLVDETELAEAKSYAMGRYQMGTQTVGQIAGWLADRYFFDGVIDDFSAVPARINAISPEQIIETARDIIRHNCWTLGLYGSTDKTMADQLYDRFAKLF